MSNENKPRLRTKVDPWSVSCHDIQLQIDSLKRSLETRIGSTPTGPQREMWTEINIHIMLAELALQKGPITKRCLVCGTTDNLHEDHWMGQAVHRCDSTDCMVY